MEAKVMKCEPLGANDLLYLNIWCRSVKTTWSAYADLSSSSVDDHDDDVMSWTLFPYYWPFVRGIHVTSNRGYSAKRALSAMRKHGG